MKQFPLYILALAVLAAVAVSGCDITITTTTRVVCRGDSVRADHADTALVRCAVLDSLAK